MIRKRNLLGMAWLQAVFFVVVLSMTALGQSNVADLVNKMPAQSPAELKDISSGFVAMGPDGVKAICAMLVPTGAGDDSKARFALSGVVNYVSRPQAEAERTMVSGALVEALELAQDKEVKAFLMTQIQVVAKDEAVKALSSYLSDETLCSPACQALEAVGTPKAVRALAAALPKSKGALRVSIMTSLATLRDTNDVPAFLKDVPSEEAALRHAALFALANGGVAKAKVGKALEKAAQEGGAYEKAKAVSLHLLYARRLAENGQAVEAERICRRYLDVKDSHVACEALGTLADIKGDAVLDDLLAAMDSEGYQVRGTAAQLASRWRNPAHTKAWTDKLAAVPSPVKAEILGMLGSRADGAAFPAVAAALKDNDAVVRQAAIAAAVLVDAQRAVAPLLDLLSTSQDENEVKAVRTALTHVGGDRAVRAIAAALPKTAPPARKALLDTLAAHRATQCMEEVFAQTKDADEGVRTASIKALARVTPFEALPRLVSLLVEAPTDGERTAAVSSVVEVAKQNADIEKRVAPILMGLKTDKADAKAGLLTALGGLGGGNALAAVLPETKSANAKVREAAVRALSDWPDLSAAPDLLKIAQRSKDLTFQVLALRGYARLAKTPGVSAAERVKMAVSVMKAAKRPDEKTLAFGVFTEARTVESLKAVAKYFGDKALRKEAALVAAAIACPRGENDKGLRGGDVAEVLSKALPLIDDAARREQVQRHLSSIGVPDAEGFVSLFNGKDLTGWVGDTAGYVVEEESIVCKPGGNLYTEGEFKDFVFRFDFKLTPGANNGIGIRAPLQGNAAYVGMEIQVLDDPDPQYKDIKPYQHHGSVYGVIPAEPGHLKPVGEWNTEEITAKGTHITVKLNDVVIVDGDIAEASANGTMDGNEHPGLKNEKGHIGFLGHGSVVYFRNLRIKELK